MMQISRRFPFDLRRLAVLAAACAPLLSGCGGEPSSGTGAAAPERLPESAAVPVPMTDSAKLGELLFHDPSLSASGRMSCASCHRPDHAHGQPDDRPFMPGGLDGMQPGFRTVPSVRYLAFNPEFRFDHLGRPRGGYNHDGRASTLEQQAVGPLLAAHEMANGTRAAVLERLQRSPHAGRFRALFGEQVFSMPEDAFNGLVYALQLYQKQDAGFQRFDAKFDAWQRGKATLDAAEQRGLALFTDRAKGNCAACHPATPTVPGVPALFTNHGFAALGVPRNPLIPANADPSWFDMGLCGPIRTDLAGRRDLCGMFRVPSLRNVARRQVFFHNGAIASLRDAVRFHVRRDTHPQEWYPLDADGIAQKFDDLPRALRGNVDAATPPFDRIPGMAPALTEAEVDDLIAFLKTLDDGYRPAP